ncbi:MAG: hypothetical protein CL844_09225 [Crocinitomicaceae bacterium]|nr:hypothetical protein [Crocinitomicaceae bacterium]|tara:strand:- start:16871 stop:17155 length:285 start_codon:yes stop_codon:yes gene_type:complete
MVEKIYKTTFWIFTIESIIIIVGINLNFIDYGIDLQTPLMIFGIILGLLISTIIYFFIRKFNSKSKEILGITASIIMAFLCFYYVLEDHFKIIY